MGSAARKVLGNQWDAQNQWAEGTSTEPRTSRATPGPQGTFPWDRGPFQAV